MVCPLLPLLGLGAVIGGAHLLYVQDRSQRLAAWLVTLGLLAAWTLYATTLRHTTFRIVLESLSVLAMLAGVVRVAYLTRRGEVHSPIATRTLAAARMFRTFFRDPYILATNVWLTAMLVMEWRGKAAFSVSEYVLVCVAIALATVQYFWREARRARTRAAQPVSALDSFAANAAPAAACPLGFACARDGAAQERPR